MQTSEILTMRNLEVFEISLIPFQYNVQSKELIVFDEVDIHIIESGERDLDSSPSLPPSRTFEQLYESLIVNYHRTEGQEYQQPAVLYICGGGSNGAIIHPAFLQLSQWRHQRGFVVYTASTDETGSSSSQIKSYIQSAYENFNPPPEFVGLVGDVGGGYSIPTFTESWSGYGGDGDHPYSQLNGDDLLPEVLIGRISVSNSTDLSVVVNKTISYEKAVDTSNNWMEKAALVGDWSNSGLSVVITNEYIKNIMENFGMGDVRTRLGQSPYPSWMESQLSEGILYFNYRGWLGTSGFGSGNINSANNGYKTPFVTFITCGTGSFSSTSISESFLRAGTVSNPKGGVAAIGTATSGTHTAFNNIVDMGIYDGIFSKGIESAGGALANGKLALFQTYPSNPSNKVSIFTHWNNLMGDPVLQLWTDSPQNFIVDYPSSIGIGTNYIEVQVFDENGDPVDMAIVTLLAGGDDIFVSEYTNEYGTAQIDIENLNFSGDVVITITKRNFIPYEGEFTVISSGPIANIIDGNILIDDSSGGNNDGMFNAGETVILQIPVHNFGNEELLGLQAHLSTSSDKIEIVDGDASLGLLGISEDAVAEFTITGSPALIHDENLNLVIDLNDVSFNQWSSLVHIYPVASDLNITGYSVQNGSMLTPGTSRDIIVTLANSGSVTASGVTAEASTLTSLIELENFVFDFGELAPGASISSATTMTVTTSDDIVNGSIFYIDFHLQSTDGYDSNVAMRVQIGEALVTDPMGPDNHGYYIYDSGDLGYNLAPQYNW
ncbi:MAG: C25 family cysteine peptidase, partial [Fidelibacterota bacterium]